MEDYRIFHLGGYQLFACEPASMGQALSIFPTYTWKKKAARAVLRGSALLGVRRGISDAFLWRDPYNASFDLRPCTRMLRSMLGIDIELVFFFQGQTERGRVYVHAWRNGRPVGFAKISQEGVASQLSHEAAMLERLEKLEKPFYAPRVIRLVKAPSYEMLVTQPLPRGGVAAPAPPDLAQGLACLNSTHRWSAAPEILRQPWWKRYEALPADGPGIARAEILELLARLGGATCGWAQGDPGQHNALRHANGLWIYDWEDSSFAAPRLTDPIGLRLASSGRQRVRTLTALQDSADDARSRLDVLLALAYRASIHIADATPLLQYGR